MGKHYLNTERAHLMNPSMNVVLKVEFKGIFNESVFRKAVIELSNEYAILQATVQLDELGRAYYLVASAKEVPVQILSGGDSFEKLIGKENRRRFNLEKESMLRIFVMPLPTAFTVIMVSHHLLGDGKSSLLLLQALCRAYVGLSNKYVGIHVMKGEENFPKGSEPSELIKNYLGNLNKSWRKEASQFSMEDYKKLFQTYHEERENGFYLGKLNAVETRKAYYHCKEMGVTLNSAIVTAFMLAQKEIDERHFNRLDTIGIGIDIRNELNFDAEKLIGNYASAITIECGKLGRDSYEKLAIKVHRKLQKKIKNPKSRWLCLQTLDWLEGDLIDGAYFSQYADFHNKTAEKCARMFHYDGEPMELGVTNLGKVTMQVPQGITVESIVFIPPAAPCNDITVGVATYCGVMEFGIAYEASRVKREKVKKIMKRVKELLISNT